MPKQIAKSRMAGQDAQSLVNVIFNTQYVFHLAKISYFCIHNSSFLIVETKGVSSY